MDTNGQSKLTLEEALKFKREALGLSQRELASRAGKSPAYVSALETGRIKPTLRSFAKLARELRLTGPELQAIIVTEAMAQESDS
jgi:transcriptional regulator with XRE-family HTH domain